MRENLSTESPDYLVRQRFGPPDEDICRRLTDELRIPRLLSVLLWQRGVTSASEADAFLQPRLADLPSPFALKGMDRAVALVLQAMREQWPICIHGDYDVDGVTSTALLSLFFARMGVRAVSFQPDRLTEGYGIQQDFIRKNAPGPGGQALLITVDCGISAVEEVLLARQLGFKVIVTDHHEPPALLPDADAIINPRQRDCSFPSPDLAGVGVAFFLSLGIRNRLVGNSSISREQAPNLKQLMDLVALGTVADVMPVTGINRILIRAGLEVMNSQPSPWVAALKLLNSHEGPLTTEDISFRLAPRLNAPGRLGQPQIAFSLLTCTDPGQAAELAHTVEMLNQQRRQVESESLDQVFAECARLVERGDRGLVVQGIFHPGVIGIIASRVVERYQRPVFILTDDRSEPGRIKGSGRSVEDVNLYEVLRDCADTLIQYGGHRMAAGLTVSSGNVANFAQRFNELVSARLTECRTVRDFIVDCRPKPDEVLDEGFLAQYQKLEPFGNGNPEPVFLLENPTILHPETVKNHLKYTIKVNGNQYRGIGFGLAEKVQLLHAPVHLAIKIKNTVFKGVKRTEIHALRVFQPQETTGVE